MLLRPWWSWRLINVSVTKKRLKIIFLLSSTLCLLALSTLFRGKEAIRGITWDLRPVLARLFTLEKTCAWSADFFAEDCLVDRSQLGVNYGVYDPEDRFGQTKGLAVSHIYVRWNGPDLNWTVWLDQVAAKNRWPLVTVEPWPKGDQRSFLADIVYGSYDEDIDEICGKIGRFGRPVFFRWGHEMEKTDGPYPWQRQKGQDYIAAYRYVVDKCRGLVTKIYFVWSPAGNQGLENYWPGQDYVDYIGLSVFSFPEWDRKVYGRERSFVEAMREKYSRVVGYGKPVMITELGVTGAPAYQKDWLLGMLRSLREFPMVKTVVYYNSVDVPGAWGQDLAPPDWRVTPEDFIP